MPIQQYLRLELMLRVPWMPGENDLDQLGKIFHIFGTPTDEDWPEHKKLPSYIQFREAKPVPLSHIFPQASTDTSQRCCDFTISLHLVHWTC